MQPKQASTDSAPLPVTDGESATNLKKKKKKNSFWSESKVDLDIIKAFGAF